MVIAVNTRLLLSGKLEGIGRFTYETLRLITRSHKEHIFVFIFDRKWSEEFIFGDNIIPVRGFPQARHPALWYMFFEHSVPAIIRKYKARLFLSPDGWMSLNSNVLSHAVIHDLNFFHYPQFIPWQTRIYLNHFFPLFIKKAGRISTVSEFSRQDITRQTAYNVDNIDVVYNGADSGFIPAALNVQDNIRRKYTKSCPFFLSVGLIHQRKNTANLIKAFNIFKRSQSSNLKLLIAGEKKWWTKEMQDVLDNADYGSDIIFTGRVPDHELKLITASAFAMMYVSYFEGFGLPILEAMNCDVPIICSNTTSMPEVAGDSALFVDPFSADSISYAMTKLYNNEALRNELINKATLQRNKFSWQNTANLLWYSIMQNIESHL